MAGRVLALGTVDLIGLLLSAAILFWIDPHHDHPDQIPGRHRKAGIPTFPEKIRGKDHKSGDCSVNRLGQFEYCFGGLSYRD